MKSRDLLKIVEKIRRRTWTKNYDTQTIRTPDNNNAQMVETLPGKECVLASEPATFGHTIISVPNVSNVSSDNLSTQNLDETADRVSQRSNFRIRLADTPQGRNAASILINKMYSWRGYGENHVLGDSPSRITLTASDQDRVIGTATLGLDTATGLLADAVFKDEIDRYRHRGSKVCEITKLAFDPQVRSKAVIASLFHIIYIYGRRLYNCTDVFIEVNPRHRIFYEQMLGFQVKCESRENPRVNAPAMLLWADISVIEQQICAYGGRVEMAKTTRSLYPHFFSPREEDGITKRLMLMA